jgi:hypothetical protein
MRLAEAKAVGLGYDLPQNPSEKAVVAPIAPRFETEVFQEVAMQTNKCRCWYRLHGDARCNRHFVAPTLHRTLPARRFQESQVVADSFRPPGYVAGFLPVTGVPDSATERPTC